MRLHAGAGRVASIGYSVRHDVWGQGFGTELARRLVEFAFGTLDAVEARATTPDENRASARVPEKIGFDVLETGVIEIDSLGQERNVTRWFLRRASARQ